MIFIYSPIIMEYSSSKRNALERLIEHLCGCFEGNRPVEAKARSLMLSNALNLASVFQIFAAN